MRPYKGDLLNHFKSLRPALQAVGATASLDPLDFHLEVRFGSKSVTLLPQFIEFPGGKKRYTPKFSQRVTMFIGWLPYFDRKWDLSTHKLKFKKYVAARDFLTPECSVSKDCRLEDVLVKTDFSTFGENIKGPFRNATDHRLDPARGEYFEKFVSGKNAKIWFWNGKPVCLEFQGYPKLTGDGERTIEALATKRLEQRGRKNKEIPAHPCLDLLAYHGKSPETVLPRGEQVVIDFRYGSPFGWEFAQDVNLEQKQLPEFEKLGQSLLAGIPPELRHNCAFTVDTVVDEKDRVWILEMNSNPFIHPFVYPAMLRSLAEDPKRETESTSSRRNVFPSAAEDVVNVAD